MKSALNRVAWLASKPLRLAVSAWLRSIQARVVLSTIVLSAIVITLLGWMLLRQVADGLVEERREVALSVAEAGFNDAEDQLAASTISDALTESLFMSQLYETLVSRSGSARSYEVVLEGPIDPTPGGPSSGLRTMSNLRPGSIPDDLKARVVAADETVWTYTTLMRSDEDAAPPGIVVGRQIQLPSDGTTYGLYYLFSMEEQEKSLGFISNALIYAGIALALLVAGIAWLVTRQVVTPVRLARRIAERLAAGRLEERMHVRGEDDIARLGQSFNQMASSLQLQIRQLEELSRVQHRFVSDVSHELRTPLTTVRMAADVLHDARSGFDPVTARSAELLQTELDRFESLLSDLLEISRFDAGAARLEVEPIELDDVAMRVVDYYQALAERHGVTLEVPAFDGDATVEADVRRIERVVRNLVVNAIHYSRSTRVVILVGASADAVALAVRDYGIGLKPGESQLVFNRFWRADPSRVRTSGGTGLGLAISVEDATLHGGWLQAWGEPDKGAQFRLTLPRRIGDELERSPLPLVPADVGVRPQSGVGQPLRVSSGPGSVAPGSSTSSTGPAGSADSASEVTGKQTVRES